MLNRLFRKELALGGLVRNVVGTQAGHTGPWGGGAGGEMRAVRTMAVTQATRHVLRDTLDEDDGDTLDGDE